MDTSILNLVDAVRAMPDDVDMIEHNPDEGQSFFCCGAATHLNIGKMDHAPDCWYVAARAALTAFDAQQAAPVPPTPTPQPPTTFTYTKWRHGGWYVDQVRYPNGACGCVSNNFADRKWRIACDERPFETAPTFKSRDAAARAEWFLANGVPEGDIAQSTDAINPV